MLKLKLQYFGHLMKNWLIEKDLTHCQKKTWFTEKELTHWKIPWSWERLKAGGEGDDSGWDGRMESPTQWTRVWANSRNWWWTGKPGVLQSMGLQRVGHNWATELNWTGFQGDKAIFIHFVLFGNIFFSKPRVLSCPSTTLHCNKGSEYSLGEKLKTPCQQNSFKTNEQLCISETLLVLLYTDL